MQIINRCPHALTLKNAECQMNSTNEVIIVAIETRHDLEGDPVPVAIDFERNEYICSWETLEKGGFDTGWIKHMKQVQHGVRSGVTFKAVDLGGEIASVVPIDPDAPQIRLDLLASLLEFTLRAGR